MVSTSFLSSCCCLKRFANAIEHHHRLWLNVYINKWIMFNKNPRYLFWVKMKSIFSFVVDCSSFQRIPYFSSFSNKFLINFLGWIWHVHIGIIWPVKSILINLSSYATKMCNVWSAVQVFPLCSYSVMLKRKTAGAACIWSINVIEWYCKRNIIMALCICLRLI